MVSQLKVRDLVKQEVCKEPLLSVLTREQPIAMERWNRSRDSCCRMRIDLYSYQDNRRIHIVPDFRHSTGISIDSFSFPAEFDSRARNILNNLKVAFRYAVVGADAVEMLEVLSGHALF